MWGAAPGRRTGGAVLMLVLALSASAQSPPPPVPSPTPFPPALVSPPPALLPPPPALVSPPPARSFTALVAFFSPASNGSSATCRSSPFTVNPAAFGTCLSIAYANIAVRVSCGTDVKSGVIFECAGATCANCTRVYAFQLPTDCTTLRSSNVSLTVTCPAVTPSPLPSVPPVVGKPAAPSPAPQLNGSPGQPHAATLVLACAGAAAMMIAAAPRA